MNELSTELATRIDAVEIKITLLEQANEEMSQVIVAQQAEIEKLSRQLEQARQQVQQPDETFEKDDSLPPHY